MLPVDIKTNSRSRNKNVSDFKSRNLAHMFELNMLNVTFRAPYEINTGSYILIIAYIDINSINTLVSCYFYRYDKINITLRKRVDLSLKYFMKHEIFKLGRGKVIPCIFAEIKA